MGSSFNLKSIVSNGLVPGGQELNGRQSVYFLPVDPRDEDHRDPEVIDYSVPRRARYLQKSWKRHQDTVFWVNIDQGIIREGLRFHQTKSNAIILQGVLPPSCIVKAERLKGGEKLYERQYLSPRPPPKIVLRDDLDWAKGNNKLGSTVEHRPVGKLVQQSLGETVHHDSPKPTQSPKTNRDSTGQPVAKEEQHVQTHDSSGQPESEETKHIVQRQENREHRETVDQFNLATNDAHIDFSVSGIPEETVKRSETMSILNLIRKSHVTHNKKPSRMISTRSSRSMRSAMSRKRRSKNQEILRFPKSSTRSRSGSASFALIIAIQGSYTVYVVT